MTDSEALSKAIENSGLKLTFIANKLELSREGFYKKLNNQTEFKASEIVKLQDILNLSNKERDKIFLQTKLNKNQPQRGETNGFNRIVKQNA